MSYENRSFLKRTLAFVLTVLLVITSMPFSTQRVKAADTEFSIKLVYEIEDSENQENLTKMNVTADNVELIFTKGNKKYTCVAVKSSIAGQYNFSVSDDSELIVSDKIDYDNLIININGYKKLIVDSPIDISKYNVAEFMVEPKKDGATATFENEYKTIKYSDIEEAEYNVSQFLKVTINPEDEQALEGKSVIYTISGGNNSASIDNAGKITGLTASEKEYVVTAKVSFDEYKDTTAIMNLTVEKAEQSDARFDEENVSVTFDNNLDVNEYTNVLSGVKEAASVTYAIDSASDSDVATIDSSNGKVIYSKAGTIKVNATIEETDNYKEKVVSYTLTIGKQAVKNFAFTNNSTEITYGDNDNKYTQNVTSDNNIGTITYSVTDNSDNYTDVADINVSTGELTIKKAGTVKVTAESAGTDTYGKASASYTLVINKADRKIKFNNEENPIIIKYNENSSYTNTANVELGSGTIEYSIISGSGKIDPSTGEVIYSSTGDITVRAYIAADECYNECSAEYTLQVKYADTEEYDKYVNISGGKSDENNDWYTSQVTISAEDGYSIRENNNQEWQTSLTINADGIHSGYGVYVKDSDGYIYNWVAIPDFKIDSSAPENLKVDCTESVADKLLNIITFGFYKNDVKVTISAEDKISGIESFKYTVTENSDSNNANTSEPINVNKNELKFTDDRKTASYTFTISKKSNQAIKNIVSFSATDAAGLSLEFNSNAIVIDDKNPEIEYVYSGYKDSVSADNVSIESGADIRYIYSGDVDGSVRISDDYLNKDSIEIHITKDGETYKTVSLDELVKENETTYRYDFKLSEEGNYVITTQAQDYSGNGKNMQSTWKCVIDKTAPTVDVVYNDTLKDNEYINERKATIRITEKNLRTSDINVSAEASDSLNNATDEYVKLQDKYGQITEVSLEQLTDAIKSDKYWSHSNDEWTSTITFYNDAEYKNFKVECKDLAKWDGSWAEHNKFVIDKIAPSVTFDMADADYNKEDTYYYGDSKSAIVTINVIDEHFDKSLLTITDNFVEKDTTDTKQVEFKADDLTWKRKVTNDDKPTNTWTTSIDLSNNEGVNVINISGSDAYNNKIYNECNSPIVIVDHTAPEIIVEYGDSNNIVQDANGVTYYGSDRKAKITIKEANFDASKVETTVEAKDVEGNSIKNVADYNSELKNPDNWTKVSNGVYEADISYTVDANYTFNIKCTDLVNHTSAPQDDDKFTIDKVAPDNYKEIKYSDQVSVLEKVIQTVTFRKWFYKDEATVTITAKDEISGIQKFVYSVSNEDANNSDNNVINNKEVYVDVNNAAFKVQKDGTVSYTFNIPAQANGKVTFTAYDYSGNPITDEQKMTDDNNIVIVDKVSPKVSVEYKGTWQEKWDSKNIYSGTIVATIKVNETYFYEDNVRISVTKDGEETKNFKQEWSDGVDADGNHICNLTFENDGDYQLKIDYHDMSENYMIIGDKQTSKDNPYVSEVFSIDTTAPVVKVTYDNNTEDNIYTSDRTAKIVITEKNFRPDEIETNITAKDINGNIVEYNAPDLKNEKFWSKSENDTWSADITFDAEAIYEFSVSYTDIAKNPAKYYKDNEHRDEYGRDTFTIAKSAPKDLKVVKISNNYKNTLNKILNAVSFGYYFYNDEVTITIQATDDISGVKYIDWEYNKEEGVSEINSSQIKGHIEGDNIKYLDDKDKSVATAEISLSKEKYDQIRGSIKFSVYNNAGLFSSYSDDNRIIIIDSISPNDGINTDEFVDYSTPIRTVDSVTYYDGDVKATLKVKEANFYAEDIKVWINDDQITNLEWNKQSDEDDTWYADITISGNGDYIVRMSYEDKSGNKMSEYVSNKIVIDTIDPIASIDYTNNNVINNINGNKIYDSNQEAVITLVEHNFRASDFTINISATDINNNEVSIPDYSSFLKDENNWVSQGDVHTARITFATEANYSLSIEYKDLADRPIADYSTDYFTVDKSDPYDISVEYSTSIISTLLQAITFGFYNAPVGVTVEMKDDISGIESIRYDYNRDNAASGVNVQQIDSIINNADIIQSGNVATVQFSIPQDMISQINGTMHFIAYDNAGNNSEYLDDRRIVVDNIAPNATVTYNNAVQNYNGISYYAEDIEATITVNEANFYADDMVINVSNNGTDYPVNPQWSDIDADTHIGTFVISGDGDYYVTINYTDKSQNPMVTYTSEQMTIDTEKPTVSISNIKNNSANKDEKYTFTITANDTNFDISTFAPILRAVVKDESGNYSIKEISLGTVREIGAGKIYSYTVDNLDVDAIYTLTCVIRDLAGNETSKVLLEDGQEYDSVVFSVNRNGSTFSVDNATESLLSNYYVYEVNRDVVVYETNVDPINNYKVKLNGIELKENTDYTTTMTNNEGEWAIRTYDIDRDLFNNEGEYKVVVESTDKTETLAYSDVKSMNISFTVDKTAPVLTVSGIENGGRYQNTEQEVTVLATDDGGRLNSFKVEVFNSAGEPISNESVRFDKSGEELINYLSSNDGKITFTVPEGLSQKVVLTCSDATVHDDGSTNETVQQFTKVTVSPSGLIIFYANKPLFYGAIILCVLVIAGGVFLIVRRVQKNKAK